MSPAESPAVAAAVVFKNSRREDAANPELLTMTLTDG
jgi:hypothetical protein